MTTCDKQAAMLILSDIFVWIVGAKAVNALLAAAIDSKSPAKGRTLYCFVVRFIVGIREKERFPYKRVKFVLGKRII